MMAPTSRSKKDKRQSMANARACAAEDRHSKRAKGSTSDPPPSRPPSPFPDLCYVDATPKEVEGAGAANDVSGEQLMGGCPADVASPPPGKLWMCLGSLLSCLIERNLRLVIDSPLA